MTITSSNQQLQLLHLSAILHLITFTLAQPDFVHYICIVNSGNYHKNLNTVLSSISSNSETSYGFYNSSAGQGSETVNAISLCRGDINVDDCLTCVNDSITKITQVCPNSKEAIGWYDTCMIRYSNRNTFHTMEVDTSLSYYLCNPYNVTNRKPFDSVLRTWLDGLRNKAASGGSLRKFLCP